MTEIYGKWATPCAMKSPKAFLSRLHVQHELSLYVCRGFVFQVSGKLRASHPYETNFLKKYPTFASFRVLDWLMGIKTIFLLRGKIPNQAEKAHIRFQPDSFQNHHENWDIFFTPQWVSHGNFALISAPPATVMRACSVPLKIYVTVLKSCPLHCPKAEVS